MSYVKLTKQLKAFLVFYLFHVPLFSLISSLCLCLWPRKLTCIISSTELCTSEFQLGSHNGKPHREIVGRREMRLEYLFPWLSSSEVALGFWLQFLTQISWSQDCWSHPMFCPSDSFDIFLIGYDIWLLIFFAPFPPPLGLGTVTVPLSYCSIPVVPRKLHISEY